ncbi:MULTISPECIES: hypothetical protein [unclassified Marinobacter]|uniref:hypothetical protein n=1 Tax=unclassified Marinobacter TaxID=83889 RepID=UPI0020104A52|nr:MULTISPECIES: hypothetical protein [unclassified Marinobacter]UQG57420.1 hypothetical protein MIH16_07215 [Marinobacter sp. M4C]UQG66225.1 hypothetical protein MIH17_07215 [Marinobacter sp. M2C]UQG70505.1 hypothetical protein MIH19_07210 [Marinobacter sp. M1C]
MAATPFKSPGYRALVVCALLYAGSAVALPAEHEIRRLMLATEQALAAENWDDASEYLGRLQQLDGERPVDFYFYRGRVMQKSDLLNEAQASLEMYVTRAGKEGQYYKQSLERITEIEKLRKDRALAVVTNNPAVSLQPLVATIEAAEGQSPADLKKLYLADSEEQALLIHLNSVLQLSGWREDKAIVQLDQPADIRYQVEKRNSSLLIQQITRQQGAMLRKSQQIDVYGISPLVKWDCEPSLATCWVYDPRDGSRLFQLGANQGQAEDIARTLGRLIRNLQAAGKQVAVPPVSG